jgi:AbrB family looped-hinge helix DNA binding protein
MSEAVLSSENRITIPREARRALGLKPGDKLLIVPKDGQALLIRKPDSFAKALKGIAPGIYPPSYIERERDNWY